MCAEVTRVRGIGFPLGGRLSEDVDFGQVVWLLHRAMGKRCAMNAHPTGLEAVNSDAASRVVDALRDAATALGRLPTGRPGRVAGVYEKSVGKLPYVIAYAVGDETLAIVRVIHTARDWPKGAWPR